MLEVRKEGTRKFIKSVSNGKELYQLSECYLQSPVQKKIYVKSNYFDRSMLLAGETALAKQSMLNFPKCTVFVLDKKCAKDISKEYIVEPKFVTDNKYVEIELWKYNPELYAVNGMVDIVSLVHSLKNIEDERIEIQIEEMMESYKW